jgi:segregation and condensation protein B
LRASVEAVLFAAGRPLSADEIMRATRSKREAVEACLRSLVEEYAARKGGVEIAKLDENRYIMQVKPRYFEHAKKVSSGLPISRGASKTLSVIAVEQPIAQAMVVQIRGRHSYKHVKELVRAGYVQAIRTGRTSMLSTTERFNKLLGCRDTKSVKKEMEALLKRMENAADSRQTKPEEAGEGQGTASGNRDR